MLLITFLRTDHLGSLHHQRTFVYYIYHSTVIVMFSYMLLAIIGILYILNYLFLKFELNFIYDICIIINRIK